MKKHYEMEPVKKWHTNHTLKGGPGVHDLPTTRFGEGPHAQVMSVWRVKGLWWRLVFLFTGEISILFQYPTHPPVSMIVGKSVYKPGEQGEQHE